VAETKIDLPFNLIENYKPVAMTNHNGHPHEEGKVAKFIEQQTAKVPSDIYLWAAVGSMLGALSLFFSGKKHAALLVGQYAPAFLIMGLYNKVVKVEGHDQVDDEKPEKAPRRRQTMGTN